MGLDTTHDCWHGSYSGFNKWRTNICAAAGYGNLSNYEGYKGYKKFSNNDDILLVLFNHSDCDGIIEFKYCEMLAKRLEELLQNLDFYDKIKTVRFIQGLRLAALKLENVEFH